MRFFSVAGAFFLLAVAGCGDEKAGPIVGGMSWVIGCDSGCVSEKPHIQDDSDETFKVTSCKLAATGYEIVVEASGNDSRPAGKFAISRLKPELSTCVVTVTEYTGSLNGTVYTDQCTGSDFDGGCTVQLSEGAEGWDLGVELSCNRVRSNANASITYKVVAARTTNDPVRFTLDNCK